MLGFSLPCETVRLIVSRGGGLHGYLVDHDLGFGRDSSAYINQKAM